MSYYKDQIEPLLKDDDEFFRMKIQSGNHETNWMNISPKQLKRIKAMMK